MKYNWIIFTICLLCVALWVFVLALLSAPLAVIIAALGLATALLMGGLFPLPAGR